MALNAQALFANLAERERLHGHHSPEGQAIRVLSRALQGWSSGNLGSADVVALCGQALEDWLKRRLALSPWSAKSLSHLLAAALKADLIWARDVERLQALELYRAEPAGCVLSADEIESILKTTIEVVERHWT